MPEPANPKLRVVPPPAFVVPPPQLPYAELATTSNFSFLRGGSFPDELVFRAAELGYTAIAITDRNTLAGVVRAHSAAKLAKLATLKLIIGARLALVDSPDVLVWAPDRAAYGRLCRLLTLGKRRASKGACELSLTDLLDHHAGLLAAVVPPDPARADASFPIGLLKDGFGDRLSLLACCGYAHDDTRWLGKLAALSRAHGVPLLASNDVHYHVPERRALQDVLTCVRERCTLAEAGHRLHANAERHLKSPEQMHRLFRDHPQALRRGLQIAERCAFNLDELKYEYPDELAPPGHTPFTYLTELTWAGAALRYPGGVSPHVQELLHKELALIRQEKIEAYFLTVHDLVTFARGRGILCQGRGSAANSAVCYCLGVTAVDPAKIDVLFERFVSTARGEPPDIDIDFEHERREEVIQYVYEKYGRDRSGMTGVVVQYRGRSAVRDVGKALGLGEDVVDQVAKRLDWWHTGGVTDEQISGAKLDPGDRTVKLLVERTTEILGFPRHLGQHSGGMVMTRGPLCELVPIENATMPGRTVIEWDKDDIDDLGILKVDILALGMLTCISKCLKLLNDAFALNRSKSSTPDPVGPDSVERRSTLESGPTGSGVRGPALTLATMPSEDPATYEMISNADTIGVFQVESRAQMTMLPRLKPKEFYDLVIEVAIVRPGPIQGDMVHPYLKRRTGVERIDYPKPELERVLHKTLGVPLFQEQAMKIVMVAAGFSGEEANRYRRAMAAWKQGGAVELFERKIIAGMLANGYKEDFALRLCSQLRGFGSYGFPESHAASFALLVYASSWIKRHHPAVFACALLNSQPMGFYAPAQIVRDAIEHGVPVRPVDVNFSDYDCTLEGDARVAASALDKARWGVGGPALRLGLRRVKGLREAHARRIVACRQAHGRFTSVEQFHFASGLPKSAIERLAEADAFNSLPCSRRPAAWQALALCDAQLPLFPEPPVEDDIELPPMPLGQEVLADYATGGLSLKAHPVSLVRPQLNKRRVIPAARLRSLHRGWVRVAGLVLIRQRPGTASGVVFMTIEDETGVANLIVTPAIFDAYRPAARHAMLLQADGPLQRQGDVIHVHARKLHDLGHLLAEFAVPSRDFH